MKTLICEGMDGPLVKFLQEDLGITADGVYGPKTIAACTAKYGTPWRIVDSPEIETDVLRGKISDAALTRLEHPLKWEVGNLIDKDVLGPMRPLIDAKEGHRFSWCASWCNYILRQVEPKFPLKGKHSGVFTSVSNFKKEAEHWHCIKAIADARLGDLVAYDWNHDNNDDHIGIFYEHLGDKLISFEGNASDAEAVRLRNKSSVSFIIDVEKLVKGVLS